MLLPLLNRLFSGKISLMAMTAGVAAYQRGDRPTARRLITIASAAAPRDIGLHDHAAAAASLAGDHRLALDLLTNAIRADPGNSDLELRAAIAQCALGDEQGAARRCEEAIARITDRDPLERRSAQRSRTTNFWTGDVWRVIGALKKYRPDLRIRTIAAAPTGLCVVRGLDPGSRVLADRYDAIVGEFLALDYAAIEADKAGFLNRFPNDWERIKEILR